MADDVTLTSTTDTQAQVEAALAGKPIPPREDTTATAVLEQPSAENTEGKTPEQVAEAARVLNDAKQKKESPEKRIGQAVAKQREAERQAEAARQQAADLQRQIDELRATQGKPAETAKEQVQPPAKKPKPLLKDFETVEDHTEAMAEWKAEEKIAALKQELADAREKETAAQTERTRQESAARAESDLLAQHATRVEQAMAKHADYVEVMESVQDVQVPAMLRTHVLHSETGTELLYFLAKHPEEREKLLETAKKGDGPLLVAIGRLESRLEAASSGPSSSAAPVSQAPDPIQPVGSGAVASTVSPDNMTPQQWREKRRREREARARR